jgi:hypothetical protein
VWPAVWSGERFLLPALPLILFYAGDAVTRLARRFAPAALKPAALAALALLVVLGVPATSRQVAAAASCMAVYRTGDDYACLPGPYQDYYRLAEIAPRILPDSAVVLSRKARSFYHLSGLPGRQYPLFAEPDTFFNRVRETNARYLILDNLDVISQEDYLAPVLLHHTAAFCVLFGLGQNRAVVFGIKPEARDSARNPGDFEWCGDEFWRSPEARDSLMRGLIPLQ